MKKTEQEKFTKQGIATDIHLLEFWQWSQSNLLNNTLRGTIENCAPVSNPIQFTNYN